MAGGSALKVQLASFPRLLVRFPRRFRHIPRNSKPETATPAEKPTHTKGILSLFPMPAGIPFRGLGCRLLPAFHSAHISF